MKKTYHINQFSKNTETEEQDYVLTSEEMDNGTLYTMCYPNQPHWSPKVRGKVLFKVLNTGNEYKWLAGLDIISQESMGYDRAYELTVFLRCIQKIESRGDFEARIYEVIPKVKFKF